MEFKHLLIQFGLPVLFVGTAVEGDAFLLVAGFLAHQGYFNLWTTIGVGAAGSYAADLAIFYIGYTRGSAYLARRPRWQAPLDRVLPWMKKSGDGLLTIFRFLYGLRSVIAFAYGMTRYPLWRFAIINAVGAVLWAGVIGWLGYQSGHAVSLALANLERYEMALAGGVILIAAVAGGLVWWRGRRA